MRGDRARRLARCFPKGVIQLVEGEGGEVEAEVGDVRKDTCSREVLRHEVGVVWAWRGVCSCVTTSLLFFIQDLRDCVELSRVRDHFICKLLPHTHHPHATSPFKLTTPSQSRWSQLELYPQRSWWGKPFEC